MTLTELMNKITEWASQNYGIVILIAVIILTLFHKQIVSLGAKILASKRKEEKDTGLQFLTVEPNMQESLAGLEENNLFNDLQKRDTLSVFRQQKAVAEKCIRGVKEEGKQLLEEEKKAALEYQQKLNKFNIGRQQLGIKYNIWLNKLNTLNNMIIQQMHMEEELKKLKDAK